MISIANSSAAWVYLHKGAVVPLIAVPSLVGVMLGARLGAHLLGRLPARAVRQVVVALPAAQQRLAWLVAHLDDLPGSGIVYTLTVAGAEDVAAALRRARRRWKRSSNS